MVAHGRILIQCSWPSRPNARICVLMLIWRIVLAFSDCRFFIYHLPASSYSLFLSAFHYTHSLIPLWFQCPGRVIFSFNDYLISLLHAFAAASLLGQGRPIIQLISLLQYIYFITTGLCLLSPTIYRAFTASSLKVTILATYTYIFLFRHYHTIISVIQNLCIRIFAATTTTMTLPNTVWFHIDFASRHYFSWYFYIGAMAGAAGLDVEVDWYCYGHDNNITSRQRCRQPAAYRRYFYCWFGRWWGRDKALPWEQSLWRVIYVSGSVSRKFLFDWNFLDKVD